MAPANFVQPSRLRDLAVTTICEDLTSSICVNDGKPRFRSGISLPPDITAQIFDGIIKSSRISPEQPQMRTDDLCDRCSIFKDSLRCKLTRFILKRAPLSDDMVEMINDIATAQPLVEVDLSGCSDMKGGYGDDDAPYNHSICLLRFILDGCGNTLRKVAMNTTLLANSIQQISTLSGKKAAALGQDQYLPSNAKIGDMPCIISGRNASKLKFLDISGSFTAWFVGIDPENPPPLASLIFNGYGDKRMNHSLKEILRNIAHGEPDYEKPKHRVAIIARSKSKRRMHKYNFFRKFVENPTYVERFVRICNMRRYIAEDDKLVEDHAIQPIGNYTLYHLNLRSMAKTLQHLSLFGTFLSIGDLENTIFHLKKLIHLDIGIPKKIKNSYEPPKEPSKITFWTFLEHFPNLQHLDLCGRPWGQALCEETKTEQGEKVLKLKLDCRPLQFLGLWGTRTCKLKGIEQLALKVSGDKDLDQLITCLELYNHTPKITADVLSDITTYFEEGTEYDKPGHLMNLLIECVQRYRFNSNMLFECTSCIYHLLETHKESLNALERKQAVDAIVIIIENSRENQMEDRLIRNAMILLASFQLPHDIIHDFDYIVEMFLGILKANKDNGATGIVAAGVCNMLVYSLDFKVKSLVRKFNYVNVMMQIIQEKLENQTWDEVLDNVWSALWNVSDETPENSKDFLENNGLELFKKCYEMFPDKRDLQRNMTGLLGNIVEVPSLRRYLAKKDIIKIISDLALIPGSELEVGYNACGIMANLLVDNSSILEGFDRPMMRSKIRQSVMFWSVDVARNISYRTFAPLLALFQNPNEPEAHIWSMWAFKNLCARDEKYIRLLIEEGGLDQVIDIRDKTTDADLKSMATQVAELCSRGSSTI